jgi:hypothetical protein
MFYICSRMTDIGPTIADPFAEAMAWQLAALRELGDLCLELARLAAGKAKAVLMAEEAAPEPEKAAAPDPVRRFERIARAVRLCVGLHDKLLHRRQARTDRLAAVRDAAAAEKLEDRRLTGGLHRAMTHFIVETAIEAEERDRETVDQMFRGLEARLIQIGEDPADFDEIHVKSTAYAIAKDIGADPGRDWWFDGWKIEVPEPWPEPEPDRPAHPPP